jgi:hypothetical protein
MARGELQMTGASDDGQAGVVDASDGVNLARSIRDSARRQDLSVHEVVWQLIEVLDTDGYGYGGALDRICRAAQDGQ